MGSMIGRVCSGRPSCWNHSSKSSRTSIGVPSVVRTPLATTDSSLLVVSSARFGASLVLSGANVSKPCLFHQILKLTTILDSHLNLRRQLLRHVDGEALVSAIAGQGVTAVPLARCTSGAVLTNARTLPERNGTSGYRPEFLDGIYKPAPDLFGCFLLSHCIGVTL